MADVITVTITGNAAGLTGAVNQATASLGTLENASTKTSGVLGNLFTGAGIAVGLKAIEALGAGMRGAIDTAVGFNSKLEQSTIAFTSMLGSAEKAQAFLAEMKAFAATTPFEFPDLLQASKQMMAFGFAASEVKPLLTAVGSAASAMGTGRSGVDSITKALGQMRAATVVQAGELNQLTEQGIPAFQILADAMGISTGEVKKLASEGKIASKVFIDAFQIWAQSNYGDMMAKQALTFEGALSTIKDSVTFATAEAFKPFFEVLSSGAVELSKFVQGETFTAWVTNVAATSRDAFRQIGDAVRTVQQVLAGEWAPSDQIEAFTLAVGTAALTLQTTFGPAVTAISTFITGTLIPAVQQFAPQIAAFVAGFSGAIVTIGLFSAAIAVVTGVLGALLSPIGLVAIAVGTLAVAWQQNWFGIQEATAAAWAAMQPVFTALVDWLGAKIPPVLEWISTVGWPALVTAGEAVATFITGTLIPGITQLIEWLGPKLVPVVTWISDTGWPALVAAGTAVGVMVVQVTEFFIALFAELEKRGVFEQLGQIWNTLVGIGNTVWELLNKLTAAFAPFQQITQEFNTGAGAVLITTLGSIVTAATGGASAIDLIAGAVQGLAAIINSQLQLIKQFLDMLNQISQIRLPSFGGGATQMSYSGTGAADPNASDADIDAYIRDAGKRRQMSDADIEKMVRNSQLERAGQGARAVGDGGKSFGPMQLYTGGGVGNAAIKAGIDVTDPSTWKQQVEFAMDALLEGGWEQWSVARDVMGLRGKPQGVKVGVPRAGVGMGDITMTQAQWGTQMAGMSAAEAAAACGPYAAYLFAQATGRNPNPAEAEQLARLSGWTEAGMGGTANFMNLLGRYGVNAVRDSTPTEQEAINAGSMVGFSTPKHYFQSTGFDPASGKFNVGATGTYAGGSSMMSYAEIERLGGGIQDIITLAGQMGPAFTEAGAEASAGMAQAGVGAVTAGQTIVTASTDALGQTTQVYTDAAGQMTAIVTNASGQVTAQFTGMNTAVVADSAAMAAGVTANTNLMATGALTSVTAMDTGILTTVQTMSGTTIATVTDMQGQVTSQYATLANGATLTMSDMAAGVMTSTTDLGTGVMTTVQDMSGNYITTITDLSGNVTSQYVTMAEGVVSTATDQTAGVTEQAQTMSENVLTSVTDLGDGVLTITTNTAGETVAVITDMAGNVTNTYTTMSSDVSGSVEELGSTVVEQFGDIASAAEDTISPIEDLGSAMESTPSPDVSDAVSQYRRLERQAEKTADAIKDINQAMKGGRSSGGGNNPMGKAAGGPVSGMTPYLVGEAGPELFMPATNGTIIPNGRISMGGGGGTAYYVTVQVNGALLANDRMIEEAVVRGLDSARRRGREP